MTPNTCNSNLKDNLCYFTVIANLSLPFSIYRDQSDSFADKQLHNDNTYPKKDHVHVIWMLQNQMIELSCAKSNY